ncbi:MAG: hypothetical protein IJA70_00965 [Oscillospiraceae bacterium]|nr:hypothetical protein [Oscillospiraceae bacterium]
MLKKKSGNDFSEKELFGKENGTPETQQSPEERAETAIAELRNRYSEKVMEQFENEAKKLREERDAALRENWILQQRAEAALPEQLAAAGINGGATETGLANLRAQFQGNRNDIRKGYLDELGEAGSESRKEILENERDFNKEWLEYLLGIAKKDAEERYN